jgi:hypothetical protein
MMTLVKRRTATAPETLEQSARDYRDLQAAVSTRRCILRGKQSANQFFRVINGKVFKVRLDIQSYPIFYTWSEERAEDSEPRINFSLSAATEADLVAARSASPAQAGQIDILLRILRDSEASAPPMRIEITNADKIGTAPRVMSVKRNDAGKLTGAVVATP